MAADTSDKAQTLDLVLSHVERQCGPRGDALQFYASMRLDVRRTTVLKRGEDVVANRARVRVVKNKLAPPFRLTEFEVIYGQGVSRTGELPVSRCARVNSEKRCMIFLSGNPHWSGA